MSTDRLHCALQIVEVKVHVLYAFWTFGANLLSWKSERLSRFMVTQPKSKFLEREGNATRYYKAKKL